MENGCDTGNGKQAEQSDVGHSIWVQCEEFRCLGYKDANGEWRNSFTGEVLPKVIGIVEL